MSGDVGAVSETVSSSDATTCAPRTVCALLLEASVLLQLLKSETCWNGTGNRVQERREHFRKHRPYFRPLYFAKRESVREKLRELQARLWKTLVRAPSQGRFSWSLGALIESIEFCMALKSFNFCLRLRLGACTVWNLICVCCLCCLLELTETSALIMIFETKVGVEYIIRFVYLCTTKPWKLLTLRELLIF